LYEKNLPKGYDYDGCDTRALELLKVENGRLVLPSGMNYRILALPNTSSMSPEVLKTIGALADKGATIVGYKKPERAEGLRGYPESDKKMRKLADEVWSKIISDKSPSEVLQSIDLKPDFNAEKDNLNYIHREIAGLDVYFVACPSLKSDEINCTFRISGKTPELWNPETGEMKVSPLFVEKDGLTTLPIRFEPSGSVFVVFRNQTPGDHAVDVKYTAVPQKKPAVTDVLKIVKAEYGDFADESTNTCINVTNIVRKMIATGDRTIPAKNSPMGGDPAGGVIKSLQINYLVNGVKKQEQVQEGQSITLPEGAKIVKAYYGIITEDLSMKSVPQIVDVTAKLKELVKDGMVNTVVSNALTDGKKIAEKNQIRVEYSFNGKTGWANARENKILVLPPEPEYKISTPAYELQATANGGNPKIMVWEPGVFEVTMASGKTLKTEVPTLPETVEITGQWLLSFPPNWGAPEQVTLDKLISWTEHPDAGVKYFSGTASYTKTFRWDEKIEAGSRLMLDLGDLENFAEVELNGKSLPLLWKPPYRLDVTDAIKAGDNVLKVKITNLWPNRLIGDEQLPEDREWAGISLKEWPQWLLDGKPSPTGRFTFTTWHHWKKDDKPLPSGLFGPVTVRQVKSVMSGL
jgi:hypothetical protein